MYILGISAYFHDSAACLMQSGRIVAACQEERFSRIKHDPAFPKLAISYCLKEAGISIDNVAHVVFYEKPFLKLDRILQTAGSYFPKGFEYYSDAFDVWADFKRKLPEIIQRELFGISPSSGANALWGGQLHFVEHHQSHAASAFFPSPFKEASIVVIDGVGEWSTTTVSRGFTDVQGVPHISFISDIRYPDSLGLLYASVTAFLGFKVNSGEYKVMGLAPYGEPIYASKILDNLIELETDGSFKLNLDYFSYMYSYEMVNQRFSDLLGFGRRKPEAELKKHHFDLAASIQSVLEEAVLRIARYSKQQTGSKNLCLAGGVALNCVANGRIQQAQIFDDVWVQPAATDAGGALGACYHVWHELLGHRKFSKHPFFRKSERDLMESTLLGPSFDSMEVEKAATAYALDYQKLSDSELYQHVSHLLANGAVVGWFQGRMEFGPRALGSRSILGDPRNVEMQRKLNLKIKFRESFRPFAPAVLRHKVQEWFEFNGQETSAFGGPNDGYDSPYMLMVAPVKQSVRCQLPDNYEQLIGMEKLKIPKSLIPACTHVDFSARIQTVSADSNPRFYRLIEEFDRLTGVPILINTSFNVRGEPIVCTPGDAIRCFLGCDMDYLVIENYVFDKSLVSPEKLKAYANEFELD